MRKKIDKPKMPTGDDMDAYVYGRVGRDTETQPSTIVEKRRRAKMARLTVDLPDNDHLAFKLACTKARTKMNEEIRQFIARRTLELERGER